LNLPGFGHPALSTWTTLLPAPRQSIHKEQELDDVAA
jgi:hypothetical protein